MGGGASKKSKPPAAAPAEPPKPTRPVKSFPDLEEEARKAFNLINKTKTGTLGKDDVRAALTSRPFKTDAVFELFDLDNNGQISFEEFVSIYGDPDLNDDEKGLRQVLLKSPVVVDGYEQVAHEGGGSKGNL
jgi:Ca2+-binding EF-hand superfamily protein